MSDSMPGPQVQEQGIQEIRGAQVAPGSPEPAAADAQAYEPAAPAPLGVQRVPTGDAGVDAQLERLVDADHLPADGHLEVYEDVHRGLRDALTALDARPQPSPSYNHRS
ncbi:MULTISPECIES: hypothetical protein [Streptomyces]|uniref:Uncharacterized protein n=1 Tax=Streptomyces maoxianensis TaxID=1459942 RepID=A0ABV9GIP5_9ACTN|nr:hypothetical protein [Streptomyces sp. ISL-1]MBT2389510.1 hypothetical protein [Streptomyces sp. ISL-1]